MKVQTHFNLLYQGDLRKQSSNGLQSFKIVTTQNLILKKLYCYTFHSIKVKI